MISDQQARQMLREAIVLRLELLREEYMHWLNELKRLDDAAAAGEDILPIAANDFLPSNVVRLQRRI